MIRVRWFEAMTDERGYNEMQEIDAMCCVLTDMQLNIFMYVHVIE